MPKVYTFHTFSFNTATVLFCCWWNVFALSLGFRNYWSSAKFSSKWYETLSVLVAKGRARVSAAASEADWSKRIREMQYADYEDHTVGS